MAALGVDSGPAVGGKPMTSIGAERKPMLKSAASGLAPKPSFVLRRCGGRVGWKWDIPDISDLDL
jgi:hypothetical protein